MKRTLTHAILAAGALAALSGTLLAAGKDQDESPQPPLGLPPIFWPDDNPYTPEKAELGRLLYFDKRLSSDGSVACASCHEPAKAFTDGAAVSSGIGRQKGKRSAPTVINRAYSTSQFWDGRSASLEDQVKGPLANPLEMTSDKGAAAAHRETLKRVKAIPGYVERFRKVFGPNDFDIDHVAQAIATFERTVLSGNSPYDRYQAGDKDAVTPAQLRGKDIFFKKSACDACHLGVNFTDSSYVNIGVGADKLDSDLGRFMVTGREEDKGAFKTPTLREIEHTGPYMHDGSMKTLEEVIEHYNKGGIKNPQLDQRIKPLNLTDQDKKDLIAFLKALNGEGWQQIKPPRELPR
jgi:cytochrome c peroxidase